MAGEEMGQQYSASALSMAGFTWSYWAAQCSQADRAACLDNLLKQETTIKIFNEQLCS